MVSTPTPGVGAKEGLSGASLADSVLSLQRLAGNRAVASRLGSTPLQRLSFERSSTGAIGGFFGRADVDAERWIEQFGQLKKVLAEPLMPGAELEQLRRFVDAYKDRKVFSDDRDAVGKAIGDRLAEAKRLRTRTSIAELVSALDAVIAGPPEPTLKLLQGVIASATPEQKKGAANDDAFLGRARTALDSDTYLQFLPALGVHRTPDRAVRGGPGATGHLTGSQADVAIRAELLAETAGAVKAGRQVEGEVSVVGDEDFQAAFERQWVVAAGETQYIGKKAWEVCEAFVDVNLPKRHIWIHRNFGDLGTIIHEGMHKYADPVLRDEQLKMCNTKAIAHGGTSRLDEGITEYFTRPVVVNQLKVPRADYYQGEHAVATKLAARFGRATLVGAYFDGNLAGLKQAVGKQWPVFAEKFERSDWVWLKANGYL